MRKQPQRKEHPKRERTATHRVGQAAMGDRVLLAWGVPDCLLLAVSYGILCHSTIICFQDVLRSARTKQRANKIDAGGAWVGRESDAFLQNTHKIVSILRIEL